MTRYGPSPNGGIRNNGAAAHSTIGNKLNHSAEALNVRPFVSAATFGRAVNGKASGINDVRAPGPGHSPQNDSFR
jgi:hypothetical protein